jgi:uncharacterized membrane protein YbaN (DUF454 family)
MRHSKKAKGIIRIKKLSLILLGSVLLALGIVGIFMPLLPTTPFVIGAALCYSHSTSQIYNRIIKNRYFGPYIENYKTGVGISLRNKIQGVAALWIILLISAFILDSLVLKLIFIIVGVAVTAHILSIKTRRTKPNI